MSSHTKWEAVDPSGLKAGDKVRVTHNNGDIIHGIYRDGLNLNGWAYVETMGGYLRMSSLGGHSFERAVPERVLPTEPGRYVDPASIGEDPANWYIYTLSRADMWFRDGDLLDGSQGVPANLVRLVPVTDVEEAEKQGIRKAHDAISDLAYAARAKIRRDYPAAFEGDEQ